MELPEGQETAVARAVLIQAAERLSERPDGVPAAFVVQLFDHTVPEDLLRYAPDDLAALAARAYAFLQERDPGRPKIRCEHVPLPASPGSSATTVVEIVNDDMPFLLDSVLGEFAERRLAVRFVTHPVLRV